MKMKSRVLSILLALAMVLTYMPVLAYAGVETLTDKEKNSSYGFFVWLSENAATASEKEDAEIAAQIISNTLTKSNKDKVFNRGNIIGGTHNISYSDLLASLDLGGKDDATSLDNLQAAVDFISRGNSYRAKESLPALKVSSALMAMAELNVDYQNKNAVVDHSDVFSVLENLAYRQIDGTWKYGKVSDCMSDDPYEGWYTEEKKNYDTNNGRETGHYKTLTNRQGAMLLTGFGIRDRYVTEQLTASDGKSYDCRMQDRYYSQTFSTKDDMYDVGNGVTPNEYLAYIKAYKLAIHKHDYQLSNSVEPTCTKDGSKTYVCSICEDSYTETVPTEGHKWNENATVDKAATCTAEGSQSIHCSVCNEVKPGSTEAIAKLDHKYGDWKTTKEASCTEAGSREKVCADCGDTVTETIAAKGHDWNNEYTVDKEATCTAEGSQSKHCKDCNEVKPGSTEAIEMRPHNYGDWKTTKEATCTETGSREKVCADCGNKVTEEIAAKGHKYGDWQVVKAATCTEDGSKERVCSDCGDKVTDTIPATGHSFGNWTETKAATVDEEGIKERTCSICGEKESASVAKKSPQVAALEAEVEAKQAANKAESAANEAAKLQKAADEAAKTPGDEAVAAANKAKEAAEAAQKAAAEAKAAAEKADSISDIATARANNGIERVAANAIKKRTAEQVTTANAAVAKADEAVKTAEAAVKKAEEDKADHIGTPEIKLSANEFTYKYKVKKSGKKKKKVAVPTPQKPAVAAVTLNGKTIAPENYDVTWSNENSAAMGTYSVTVTLKGSYSGSETADYSINPKAAKISKPAKGKKKMTVKWKKASKNDIKYKAFDGYEIQYSLTSDFSSKVKTIKASKKAKSKTIKKLKSKKKYYVHIRRYKKVKGGKVYSAWSAVKTVKVK